MNSLEENINQAIADFDDIESAIKEQGVDVPYDTDTSQYGDLIRSIGAGSDDKVFEKITTVTVTPDADGSLPYKIVISQDDNGQPFELSSLCCFCFVGLTDGAQGKFFINSNGGALAGILNPSLTETCRNWYFRYDSYGENNGGLFVAPNSSVGGAMNYSCYGNANCYNLWGQPIPVNKKNAHCITQIELVGQIGTARTFVEGSTFELWGVRI